MAHGPEEVITHALSGWAEGRQRASTAAREVLVALRSRGLEVWESGRGYRVDKPSDGWREQFSEQEKEKLRPVAETLAMLDGNAFFTLEGPSGKRHYEYYLPEAHAIYEANGGDGGWAGEAAFAKPFIKAQAASVDEQCQVRSAAERTPPLDGQRGSS